MKLKTVNPFDSIKRYGFKNETMDYKNNDFKGHQLGICVCVVINSTKKIEKSYLENDNDISLAKEILKDENVILIKQNISQLDENDNLIDKTIYYLPFVPENHTSLKPIVLETNITSISNAYWNGEIEILFVTLLGIKRYVTMPFLSHNVNMLDLMYSVFDSDDNFIEAFKDSETPMEYEFDEEEDKDGYKLDFYNDIGQKYNTHFNINELYSYISSVRLIKLVSVNDKE